MSEKKDRIAKIFWVGSRMCLVIYMYSKGNHNGYVESRLMKDYDYYDELTEEPTFSGKIEEVIGKYFIGFDTCHSHDTEESQSLERVIDRTRKFAESLIIEEDKLNESN